MLEIYQITSLCIWPSTQEDFFSDSMNISRPALIWTYHRLTKQSDHTINERSTLKIQKCKTDKVDAFTSVSKGGIPIGTVFVIWVQCERSKSYFEYLNYYPPFNGRISDVEDGKCHHIVYLQQITFVEQPRWRKTVWNFASNSHVHDRLPHLW